MTPEQLRQLNELYAWMQDKKRQQISFPLDTTSKKIISDI